MPIKLTLTNTFGLYSENNQPNPIRWTILRQDGDESFVNVSNKFRCKDYFNDVVYNLQTGQNLVAYGFDTTPLKLNKDEPVPLLLSDLDDCFEVNLQMLNTYLDANILPTIDYKVVKQGTIVFIDPWYWKSTYRISLLTLIIRLLNYKEIASFDALAAYKAFPYQDQEKWDAVVKKKMFFHTPEKWNKYVWYTDPNYNSEKIKLVDYNTATVVHNNGVLSWYNSGL